MKSETILVAIMVFLWGMGIFAAVWFARIFATLTIIKACLMADAKKKGNGDDVAKIVMGVK